MAADNTQITTAGFHAKIKLFEGNPDYLYLDTEGKVTVGVGLMFSSGEALVNSRIVFTVRSSGKRATPNEIKEEFKAISKLPKGRSTRYYEKLGLLKADTSSLESEFAKRINTATSDAIVYFNVGRESSSPVYVEFSQLPALAQFALIDMAFNLGRPKLLKYRNLKKALEEGGWEEAAKQSHRRGIQSDRNSEIFNWLKSCQSVSK
jgi:GH24 family phage-related lysozyme (muramidase)